MFKNFIDDFCKMPVSFRYGAAAFRGLGGLKKLSQTVTEDRQKTNYIVKFALDEDVEVTVTAADYKKYAAYEWTLWFENKGDKDSKVLGELYAADMCFRGNAPVLKGIYGDGGVGEGPYAPYEFDLLYQPAVSMTPPTGRGTYHHFPYFNLQYGAGGTMIAVGWSAMWKADFRLEDGAVHFTAGQKQLETYLKPGEKIRTPLMAFLEYDGRGDHDAANLWRHWFMECNMRRINGRLFEPNVSGGTSWAYNEMKDATDENQVAAMDTYYKNGVPLTYWWMDAGWYFRTREEQLSTWLHTGTWMVDTKRFPSEFRAISDFAAKHDAKTLLWFEPEVVRLDWFDADKEHGIKPEYMLTSNLVDFGNAEFRKMMFDRTCSILDKGGISLYRQDYGINPDGIFNAVNRENRIGVRENFYVQGYYAYWDMLIERYPDMMIDSCAAGGGRNDIESMRRSVPLHKTDHDYSNQTDKQAMHAGLFSWLPYFGSCVVGPDRARFIDKYDLRSSYCSWIAMGYDVRSNELDWKVAADCIAEWNLIKEFYYADYYPVVKWSNKTSEWRGWEFFDPEKGAGFVQLFRPENCVSGYAGGAVQSPSERQIRLYGLKRDAVYRLTDRDGNCSCELRGDVLLSDGFRAILPEPRSSAVILINEK
ncbi:MAG: alpha-galactosidase [Clostridia bacterium]